jgi:fluoride ion exporter CrcB/FEX
VIWVGVALLGGTGAVLRVVMARRTGILPVNLLGAFVAGLCVSLDGDARLLVAGGLLGAFTTFSAWMYEARDSPARVILPALVAGLLAAELGRLL